ncbi:MAG: cell envelope integrity protein TolA [Aeromonadaceae bacterium]
MKGLMMSCTLLTMVALPTLAKQTTDYEADLVRSIQQHWQGDKRLHGRQCSDLSVSIAPNGSVVAVSGGEGDASVCQAARRTLANLKQLPVPNAAQYERYQTMLLTLQPGSR